MFEGQKPRPALSDIILASHWTIGAKPFQNSFKNLLEQGNNLQGKNVDIPWISNLHAGRLAKRFFWSKPSKDNKNRY